MSVTRACYLCRFAKAKCDLARPVCGRCKQRGLICSGFPADASFIFRDENEAAQRNSKRARREHGSSSTLAITFDLITSQETEEQQAQAFTGVLDPFLQQQYPWSDDGMLTEVPGPLKRDLETRAVDRFFVNWTLHPRNDISSPGHMHELHTLYLSAPPESVLWLAVRAMAFADMRRSLAGGTPFYIKARRAYGAALSRLRESMRGIMDDEQDLADDRVLAAILLINSFELIYLARADQFGPHIEAIRYILRARGDQQFCSGSRIALWRVGHHHLQARQILLREEPDSDQIAWLSKLNIDRPDFRISADIMHISILIAEAKRLTQGGEDTEAISLEEKIGQARQLAHTIEDCIASIESWTSATTGEWKPEINDLRYIEQPLEMDDPISFPIPHFPCPRMLSWRGIWLAYTSNFHSASQIVLRESLADVISYIAIVQGQEPDLKDMERIQSERYAVDRLSASIIRSFPSLLGLTHRYSGGPYSLLQGKMVGRFFSLFSMWVVQKAHFTSLQHKQTASEVIQWINSLHRLD